MPNQFFSYKVMRCANCTAEVQRTGPKQRFCAPCSKEHRKARKRELYAAEPSRHRQRAKSYYEANLEKSRAKSVAWFAAHPDYGVERYRSNPEEGRAKAAKWRAENAERVRSRQKERRLTDPHHALAVKIRRRIYMALRGGYEGTRKAGTAIKLLGCSFEELRFHIERQFTDGMSWDKCFNGEIHLDHIRPCSSFDLTDPEQQKLCFHFSNLQPLWATDNLKKGGRWAA